jgi:hypothetical protein
MIEGQAIGLAGELRIMSILLLNGHNPAKSYLDNGVDIILENGIRIQVKSSLKKFSDGKGHLAYRFGLAKGNKKRKIELKKYADVLICWGAEDDVFWIMPTEIVEGKFTLTLPYPNSYKSQYKKYIDAWKLLREGR